MTTNYLVAEESQWRIPSYAQKMLWVRSGDSAVRASGPRGEFDLDGDDLQVAWGTADGPVLFTGSNWQGKVAVGGFVERLHVLEVRDLEVVIAEVEGGPLPPDYLRLPTLAQMASAPFRRDPDSLPPISRDQTYTFLALADSVYAEYLHHAVVSELPVDIYAELGPQKGHWQDIVGLPLLIEAMSLLAG